NFVPAISLEGFQQATDSRRGRGTFKAVQRAMKILKERKLLFGNSCCYTRANAEVIGSEEYFDFMIESGAKFAWFFLYMPIGVDAVPDLMVTAGQRKFMYRQIRKFRNSKPLFTLDFWNDGKCAGGCIAGGRSYLHINANGDVEPCAFIHYSNTNIHEKTLLDALRDPIMTEYRKNQPFNKNLFRPCPLLDNKGKLAEMVDRARAKSTDLLCPEDVHAVCAKCADAADQWEKTADELWDTYYNPQNSSLPS
ncbi:MAG TPA: radical SAM protein, partial [Porphyromonadaceae bacterium]|nr:radical SAM protein [Porphyromonadaceae bacterium]